MAFPRNSLRAFLGHARASLSAALCQNRKVTLVVGNTSADLDSLTAAILYAYIRSQHPPSNAFTPLYLPLLNIPRDDVGLRPEFHAVFRHANIDASHIITLDDLPSKEQINSLPPERTRWIVVDHNALQGTLGSLYSSRVHGVVDHHEEENAVTTSTEPEPRIIKKCGSCTSLVVHYLEPSWDTISSLSLSSGAAHGQDDTYVASNDAGVVQVWDAQVAKLALASILIDTRNLTDKSKTEDADCSAVAYLEAKIRLSARNASTWDRTAFYEEIDAAKNDIENIDLKGILRKDYKAWTERGLKLGISSVVKPLEFLAAKATQEQNADEEKGSAGGSISALATAAGHFMRAHDLDLYSIMTASTASGTFRRELFLKVSEQAGNDAVGAAERFKLAATSKLSLHGLEDWDGQAGSSSKAKWSMAWRQGELGMSRKQVAPLLREALQADGSS